MDSLPDELLFDILSRVPAKDILKRARFVCKRWKRLIHGDAFAQAHLHRSGYGLLISTGRYSSRKFMAATHGGGIEVSKLSSRSKSLAVSSCNGLILLSFGFANSSLHVVNPVTKGRFKLPKLRVEGQIHEGLIGYFDEKIGYFGIAYAASSMKYKVVATYWKSSQPQCQVLTVGVDEAWRHVAIQQLSSKAERLLCCDPLITEGFMHWAWSSENAVLTLNVEAEVFVETPSPRAPKLRGGPKYHYLSTGGHLTVLICCGDYLWQVWEMEGGSGEWRRVMANVSLNAHRREIQQIALKDHVDLRPVGWVKYPEVLLFFSYHMMPIDNVMNTSCIVYNLDSDRIKSVKLPSSVKICKALVHKNSLLVLRRGSLLNCEDGNG